MRYVEAFAVIDVVSEPLQIPISDGLGRLRTRQWLLDRRDNLRLRLSHLVGGLDLPERRPILVRRIQTRLPQKVIILSLLVLVKNWHRRRKEHLLVAVLVLRHTCFAILAVHLITTNRVVQNINGLRVHRLRLGDRTLQQIFEWLVFLELGGWLTFFLRLTFCFDIRQPVLGPVRCLHLSHFVPLFAIIVEVDGSVVSVKWTGEATTLAPIASPRPPCVYILASLLTGLAV